MYLQIPQGATSKIIQIPIFDSSSTTGALLAGLVFNSAGLTAYYNREGAAGAATAITLATATKGTWATGGFAAVDGTNMPGWYELHIPDAALASGAKSVSISLKGATNMVPVAILCELTATSNQNATTGGIANLDAAVSTRMATFTQPTGFLAASFPTTVASTTNITAGTVTTATNVTTVNDKTGYALSATGLDAITQAAVGVVEIVKGVWDRVLTGATHNIVNSAGRKIRELAAAHIAFSGTINDAAATTTTFNLDAGASTVDNFYRDASIVFSDGALQGQARLVSTYTGATRSIVLDEALSSAPVNGVGILIQASHAHTITAIQAGLATSAALTVIDDYIDTEVAAIKAKTDLIPAAPAAVSDIPTAIQNADALLNRDMATGTDSGSPTVRTVRQALRFLRNKWSISAGTLTVTKEDDVTASFTATVTTDAAAVPITGSDPA